MFWEQEFLKCHPSRKCFHKILRPGDASLVFGLGTTLLQHCKDKKQVTGPERAELLCLKVHSNIIVQKALTDPAAQHCQSTTTQLFSQTASVIHPSTQPHGEPEAAHSFTNTRRNVTLLTDMAKETRTKCMKCF